MRFAHAPVASILALMALVSAGCSGREQSAAMAPPPPNPVVEDVRGFLTGYFEVWSKKDIKSYEALFDAGATIHFVREGGQVIPWPVPPFIESQRQAHAAATTPMVESADRMEIHVSPDERVAQAAVKWRLVQGPKTTVGWDHFTLLRRDNTWRILNLTFYEE
jgi:hypothetical protein